MRNYPLVLPDMAQPLSLEGGSLRGNYPFEKFQTRNQNYAVYSQLMRGDFSYFMSADEKLCVVANYFSRLSAALVDLLFITPPLVGGEDNDLNDSLFDSVQGLTSDLTSHGNGVVVYDGGVLESVDPGRVYPTGEDSEYYSIITIVRDQYLERQVVLAAGSDGDPNELFTERYKYTGDYGSGVVGTLLEEDVEDDTEGDAVAIEIQRVPIVNGIGTSMYDDLIPLVVELARRYSKNSKTLDAHADPLLLAYMTDAEYAKMGAAYDPTAQTVKEQMNAGDKALKAFRRRDIAQVGDPNVKMEYLTWDAGMESSFKQIEQMVQEIGVMTGLAQLLKVNDSGMSGVALRRLMLPLFAATLALQREMIRKISTLVEAEIVWPHPFEELEGQDQSLDETEQE